MNLEEEIIRKFSLDSSAINMDKLIHLASSTNMTDDGIVLLAKCLAESGKKLNLKSGRLYGDIPSTGGPSSLSTLICPLILAELNIYVPKLGVPGRPAGGIDVLYQIPGYKIFFSETEISQCLEKTKYCHFVVSDEYAPLDKILFEYRSKVGAKSIPSLVIASILAKKIAAGLNITGLDVRVSEVGNFGNTWEQARKNSYKFVNIANKAGIKAKCYLTNNNILQQPYLGRSESLIALSRIFSNNCVGLIKDHFFRCADMATNLANPNNKEVPSHEKILKRFEENLTAQGTSLGYFQEKTLQVEKEHIFYVVASQKGFLHIDLAKIRDTIVFFQNSQKSDITLFPDPCGIIFHKINNEYVEKEEVILSYRANTQIKNAFHNLLMQCFEIKNNYQQSNEYQIIE